MTEMSAVLDGIHAAVHELADTGGLIDQLAELLADKGTSGPDVATSRPAPGSRTPWDARVANAYTTIHAWARHAEADLGSYVVGQYRRQVAGSDRITRHCLEMVACYCDTGRVPEAEVRRIARHLGRLVRAAQSVPGIDTAPPAALSLHRPCPVCEGLTLQADPTGGIFCADEGCIDPTTDARTHWTRAEWPALLARLELNT